MATTTQKKEDFKTTGTGIGNGADNKMQDAMDKTKDAASKVGEAAGDAAKGVGQKADQMASAVGQKAQSAADSVRQYGPDEGLLGSAAKAVADTIDQSGKYLEKEGLTGMVGDISEMIKRNPVPAHFVGIGIGYLLGRALDRS